MKEPLTAIEKAFLRSQGLCTIEVLRPGKYRMVILEESCLHRLLDQVEAQEKRIAELEDLLLERG